MDSFDIAVELYTEISALMNKVANQPITNHEVVEAYQINASGSGNGIATSGVYATTYGNSVKFIVNYNDYDVELADGATVPAKGYLEVNVK